MIKGKIRPLKKELSDDLRNVETFMIKDAEDHTEEHLTRYNSLRSSFNSRYICADLMKETYPLYSESIETRKRYSEVVHNSCACLAAELFERTIKTPEIDKCIFLTGVPGAGKSYLIQSLVFYGLVDNHTLVYEGDITTPTIKEKMKMCEDNDVDIMILVVNPTLELAQSNAIRRHFEIGRGASCETMARIMSKLPNAIKELEQEFNITLGIFNKSTNHDTYSVVGDSHIDELDYGTYDEILLKLQELRDELLPGIREEFEKKKLINENNEEYEEQEHAKSI